MASAFCDAEPLSPSGSIGLIDLSSRRPIVLVIDVEPDERKTSGGSGGWESSEVALDHLERLRDELAHATGAAVQLNWFIRYDPQIEQTWGRADIVADACPRIIRTIEQHGDYAGVHVHLWRWDSRNERWYNDFTDRAWTAHCLDVSIDGHKKVFGEAPAACRFGDRFLSRNAVELMRSSGIRYDLTVEPGLPGGAIHDDPHATGALPDFRSAPREPWSPAVHDYLVPAAYASDDDLWMIPLTTTEPALRLVRRAPYLMIASRSPNLSLSSSYVWPHIRRELDRPGHSPLVIVFRSGDLSNQRFLSNFTRNTRMLVRHPALAYCDFTNPADALARWRSFRANAVRS